MVPLAATFVVLAPFNVTLTAPTHTPRVDTRWVYAIEARTRAGKPLEARVTVQIVDPFGGVHPVEFGNTKKSIVAFRFRGRFRDFIEWPRESRGFRLTLRVTVTSGGRTVRLAYRVRPR